MEEYIINVTEIEELQTTNNTHQLDAIFRKAKSTIVNGEKVVLLRRLANGRGQRFDEISTEEALTIYKKSVFKYL